MILKVRKVPVNGRVAVIGAGISGLTYSYFLRKLRPDIKITIFESSRRVGGWISSRKIDLKDGSEVFLEKGPRTLRVVSDGTLLIIDILKQLGATDQIYGMKKDSVANRKYLLTNTNELLAVPYSTKTAIRFLGSGIVNDVLKGLMLEPFRSKRAQRDESVAQFFRRRLGNDALTNNIISAIYHGIYAGDVAQLSVQSLMPKMVELEKTHGSLLRGAMAKRKSGTKGPVLPDTLIQYSQKISPNSSFEELKDQLKGINLIRLQDGLETFPNAVAASLKGSVDFRFGSEVTHIDPSTGSVKVDNGVEKFDHIRSTINTNKLLELLQDDEMKNVLSLDYVSVLLANIYTKKPVIIPEGQHGFGFLVPKSHPNEECLLGTIFDSDIENYTDPIFQNAIQGQFSKTSTYNKVTLMIGGHFYNDRNVPSGKIIEKKIKNILQRIFDIRGTDYNLIFENPAELFPDKMALKANDVLISYNLHENCIPQYNVGYEQKKALVSSLIASKYDNRISLGGMAFGEGVGVPDCVMSSLGHALEIA